MVTSDKAERIRNIRNQIKAMTPEQRQQLTAHGIIGTIDGRQLSTYNTLMVYYQAGSKAAIPSIVGGFKQWLSAGRVVSKGEHGYTILFPCGQRTEDDGEVVPERFLCGTVFDITQTTEVENGQTNS